MYKVEYWSMIIDAYAVKCFEFLTDAAKFASEHNGVISLRSKL